MGAVVVLAVIGVVFLIVVGAVCSVRKRRQSTVNKPAHNTFGEWFIIVIIVTKIITSLT